MQHELAKRRMNLNKRNTHRYSKGAIDKMSVTQSSLIRNPTPENDIYIKDDLPVNKMKKSYVLNLKRESR